MKILLIATIFILGFFPRAMASERHAKWQNNLKYGEKLFPGQRLRSDNGRFVLDMQMDGNLVLFDKADGGSVVWSSEKLEKEEEDTILSKIKGLATHVKNALVNPKMNERQQRYAYVESGHLNTELMVVGFNYDWVHPTYKRAPIFCHNCTFIKNESGQVESDVVTEVVLQDDGKFKVFGSWTTSLSQGAFSPFREP